MVNVLDPLGKLRVLDRSVTTDADAALASKDDKMVRSSEVEFA